MIEPGKMPISAGGHAEIVLDANVLAKSNEGSKLVLDANAQSDEPRC